MGNEQGGGMAIAVRVVKIEHKIKPLKKAFEKVPLIERLKHSYLIVTYSNGSASKHQVTHAGFKDTPNIDLDKENGETYEEYVIKNVSLQHWKRILAQCQENYDKRGGYNIAKNNCQNFAEDIIKELGHQPKARPNDKLAQNVDKYGGKLADKIPDKDAA